MRSRRRYDPWARLFRPLTAERREDLRLATRFGALLDDGWDPVEILAALDIAADEAGALAGRIRDAIRAARLSPEPTTRLARVLVALDKVAAS